MAGEALAIVQPVTPRLSGACANASRRWRRPKRCAKRCRASSRIGQSEPVQVVVMAYRNSLLADALKRLESKLQPSLAVEAAGDGISGLDGGPGELHFACGLMRVQQPPPGVWAAEFRLHRASFLDVTARPVRLRESRD